MGEPHQNLLATVSVGEDTLQGILPLFTLLKPNKTTIEQFIEGVFHLEDELTTLIETQRHEVATPCV